MQTILGSTGSIGKLLAKELIKFTEDIQLVSRNPVKINSTDRLLKADLLDKSSADNAVKGSDVVYLVTGLKYDINVWQRDWPILMNNVIEACKKHNSKLVFFDNIYMIDPAHISHITEESPINPSSKKGEVRAKLDNMILDEIKNGNLNAIIARAADFYGPTNENLSVLNSVVYERLKSGKSAQWFINPNFKHSFTFTPDAAKAMAILGNSDKAFNQIWNLPTDRNILSGNEWVEKFAEKTGAKPKIQVAGKFLMKIMSLFVPPIKEFIELSYQWENDYFLDSSKFEREFKFKTTSYQEGINSYFK
jgi:nucleoside-diphosphate-sugar epimerase